LAFHNLLQMTSNGDGYLKLLGTIPFGFQCEWIFPFFSFWNWIFKKKIIVL
jgi:hypothetical protein